MLGSVADAEDVVQEAALRLHQGGAEVASTEAYLYSIVSNLCVDKLRREKVERKHYPGPWLPDPIEDDNSELAGLAEQLSMGFMLLLERLSPAERIVYVLREGFDFTFDEIAGLLNISSANARQRASRARARMRQEGPAPASVPGEQKVMLETLVLRVAEGDVDGLVALMADDVVAYTDGGGVASAAIRPVYGPARIAQVMLHLAQKVESEGDLAFEFLRLNGGMGMVVRQNDEVHSCFQVAICDGRISHIYVTRHPGKLAHLK